jgi:hypothetical protein|tara:strand:- start:56 stop:721 length:666 start_codon:yes stop_codon:yes gene_type:complete
MANTGTSGFGLKAAMRVGNTPSIGGQSKYQVKSGLGVGIFKGNPVSRQHTGDEGYIQDVSFATTDDGVSSAGGTAYDNSASNVAKLIGVFNGIFFIDNTTEKPTFANSVAASTTFGTNPNTGSTDGIGFVNDDPLQEYIVKSDAAVPQTKHGDAFNVKNFTASDAKNGQSTAFLAVDGVTGANTKMFRVVRSAEDPNNEDLTAANCNIVVAFNAASNVYLS